MDYSKRQSTCVILKESLIQLARPQHNCKLAKAIYGLKQTPRAWFHRLRGALLGLGISQHKNKEDITFLLIYICRWQIILLFVTGSNSNFLKAFLRRLNLVFALKDLGQVHYFLGREMHKMTQECSLSRQGIIIKDLLKKFSLESASICPTSMVIGRNFTTTGEQLKNPTMSN